MLSFGVTSIAQLPPETLLYIFAILSSCPSGHNTDPWASPALVLSGVCQRWRAIVHQNGKLWANIFVGWPTYLTKVHLEYSRAAYLSITIDPPPITEPYRLVHFKNVASLAMSRSGQIRVLDLSGSLPVLLNEDDEYSDTEVCSYPLS